MQDLGLDSENVTLEGTAIELKWHEKARLLGVIGEAVFPAWLKRCKRLKGYTLWRRRPDVRESFRKQLLNEFWFYNLENEKLCRSPSGVFADLPAKCPICGKAFSKGRDSRACMMLHVYKQHKDVCRGYDYVKAYLDRILFWKKIDNVLVREMPYRGAMVLNAVVNEKIKTLDDFETVFSNLMVSLAPIIAEVKTSIVGKAGRLSDDQKETRALALNWGWGWLTLNVGIGERVTVELVGLQMPDEDKIIREVRKFFH